MVETVFTLLVFYLKESLYLSQASIVSFYPISLQLTLRTTSDRGRANYIYSTRNGISKLHTSYMKKTLRVRTEECDITVPKYNFIKKQCSSEEQYYPVLLLLTAHTLFNVCIVLAWQDFVTRVCLCEKRLEISLYWTDPPQDAS